MTQFEDRTEVLLVKEDVALGGDILVARFRLWIEADGVARAITATRPHLRMAVINTRQGRNDRVDYVNGRVEGETPGAGGEFPILVREA